MKQLSKYFPNNFAKQLKKLVSALLISLFGITLPACSYSPSTLKDSYNNLGKDYSRDLKQMGDYTPEQENKLDQFGDGIIEWHRKNKLPELANMTKSLSTKLENSTPLTNNDYRSFITQLGSFPNFHESEDSNRQLAKLAKTLNDEQFTQIKKQIEEDTSDYTEHFQNTSWDKLMRESVSGMSETFRFLGVDLTKAQLTIIQKNLSYQRDNRGSIISSNEDWNNRLIELLSKRHEASFEAQFAQHMLNDNLYVRFLKSEPEETEHNTQITMNMLKELFASLSEKQRATFTKQLKSISQTLSELVLKK